VTVLGWSIRPVRTYQRKKDEAESVFWGASKRVNGKHKTVYLGKVESVRTERGLRRVLTRRLREVAAEKGLPIV